MIHFDLPKEKSSIIKVIGVGGGGSNAVNYMYSQHIEGVNFIICNTDAQAIAQSQVPNRVQLGPHLTQGLGAGANPEIGRQATEESLEEIRRILEVNTKMAFITAGMGGGTGTGGAPIIAKICRDLGILTVGIVTTPFSYEGKKRQQQAEEGIRNLKKYVDTLLIISNDKLRHQFGNLRMKQAFSKADNILATAAKCITDVINSTGQINVDFADVCTVMRDGGVAMLGSAVAEGPNRARQAVEEALNSPLLNDSDIRGAKWILLNINSAEGEHEFTMDEVEVIQQHILSLAGEDSDVILGMGYDPLLGEKLGITIIASGYEFKDPFVHQPPRKTVKPEDEKVVMVLDLPKAERAGTIPVAPVQNVTAAAEPISESIPEPLTAAPVTPVLLREDLQPKLVEPDLEQSPTPSTVNKQDDESGIEDKTTWVLTLPSVSGTLSRESQSPQQPEPQKNPSTVASAPGGYLSRPVNIYAESNESDTNLEQTPRQEQVPLDKQPRVNEEAPAESEMQLVFREDLSAVDMTRNQQVPPAISFTSPGEHIDQLDEVEEQKRRAAERIQKLRNLSFNVNGADPKNEFETVPAYIRRNLELHDATGSVENFYSSYEVRKEEDQSARISTLNTFLNGKKPD